MPNKKFLIFAVLLASVTTFIVFSYMSSVKKESQKQEAKRPVVVAKVNIPTKTILTLDMLEIKKIPAQYVPEGIMGRIKDAEGKVLVINAMPGQMIFSKDLKAKEANLGLSFIIPATKRAVSVQVNSAAGIAGLIKPGDMVDILVTLIDKDQTITVLQNVQVLAINQQMEMKSSGKSKDMVRGTSIVTFALDLKSSEKLILAENKGPLQLALRSVQDNVEVKSYGTKINNLIPAQPYRARVRRAPTRIKIIKGTKSSNQNIR